MKQGLYIALAIAGFVGVITSQVDSITKRYYEQLEADKIRLSYYNIDNNY